jgi:hypothetical protein
MDRTGLEDLQEIGVYISIPRRLQKCCPPPKLVKPHLLLGDDEKVRLRIKNKKVNFKKNCRKGALCLPKR